MAELIPCPVCGGELAARRGAGGDTIDCEQLHRANCDADLYERARLGAVIDDLNAVMGLDVPRRCPGGQHHWMRVRGMVEVVSCPMCDTLAVAPTA